MTKTLCAVIVAMLVLTVPTAGLAQVLAPLSPYPQCHPNKAAISACTCGVRPAAICPTGSWCSFSPEGAPVCTRHQPLHR